MGCPRILLAEDNPEMRDRVCSLLRPDFDVVGWVADGQQAIKSALTLKPDILLTDISMPVLNGVQVARHLRDLGCQTRVIFLSVHEDQDYIDAVFSIGAFGYILKSRIAADLVRGIQQAMKGRRFNSPLPLRQS